MNYKLLLIFCILYAHKLETSAESVKCNYSVKKIYLLTKSSDRYTCELSANDVDSSEYQEEIAGNHEASNTDGNVEVLQSFSDSTLQTFSSSFCNKFSNLLVIKFVNEKISSIFYDALQNCANLKILTLNSVGIFEIPERLLSENSKLVEIEISGNKIESLPKDTFEKQENLEKLNLKNNKIQTLDSNIFSTLKKLQFLYLDDNQIQILHPKLFKKLRNLRRLSLNSNKIADLPESVFANLKNLQIFEINSNQLSVINSNSFSQTHSHLTNVDFKNNEIFAVDPKFFNCGPINTLIMDGNECLDDTVYNRNGEDLQTCYDNFKGVTMTTSAKPITTPKPTPKPYVPITPTTQKSIITPQLEVLEHNIDYRSYSDRDYPWTASIMLANSEYQCGGVLVTAIRIVTAKSCMHSKIRNRELLPRDMHIVLGSRRIYSSFETGRKVSAVHRYRVHESADIAVIFLEYEQTESSRIRSVGLNTLMPDILSVTDAVYVTHGSNKSLSEKNTAVAAGYLEASILDSQFCPNRLKNDLFCISKDSQEPVCVDTIGSGLFVKHNNQFYLRGILSYVSGSCKLGAYSLFTDVSKYVDWVATVPPEEDEEEED